MGKLDPLLNLVLIAICLLVGTLALTKISYTDYFEGANSYISCSARQAMVSTQPARAMRLYGFPYRPGRRPLAWLRTR